MVYNRKNLSVLAYANGFTLWAYQTDDDKRTIYSNGYFNGAFDILRVGDHIHISGAKTNFITSVAGNENGKVTIETLL